MALRQTYRFPRAGRIENRLRYHDKSLLEQGLSSTDWTTVWKSWWMSMTAQFTKCTNNGTATQEPFCQKDNVIGASEKRSLALNQNAGEQKSSYH